MYVGRGGTAPPNLATVINVGKCPSSRSFHFTPWGNSPNTYYIEGFVGPRAGLHAVEKINLSCLYRGSSPGRPVRIPSLYRLTYPGCSPSGKLPTRSLTHPQKWFTWSLVNKFPAFNGNRWFIAVSINRSHSGPDEYITYVHNYLLLRSAFILRHFTLKCR